MARCILFCSALAGLFLAVPAGAASLASHRAVYDMQLAAQTSDIVAADGRIAMELKRDHCDRYALDYRFVARFQEDQEITLTDQQTISSEAVAGDRFEFTTKTYVDGSPQSEVKGVATSGPQGTHVAVEKPSARSFDLPRSIFPAAHTAELIEKAKAGERIVEEKLFDGGEDSEKLLTSTAIIGPLRKPENPSGGGDKKGEEGHKAEIDKKLSGLKSWKIHESYYSKDSDPDGLPIFQTSYVLYENGVSDDLVLDYGSYALKGSLGELDLLAAPNCP